MIDTKYKPHFSPGPDFTANDVNASAAMANGKRYEAKSLLEIGGRCALKGWNPQSGPWIKYKELDGGLRYCQPDVVVTVSETDIILVEIKLKHTRKAFVQLDLYSNCLKAMKPGVRVTPVIWCKYFDPVEGVIPVLTDLELNPNNTYAVVWK